MATKPSADITLPAAQRLRDALQEVGSTAVRSELTVKAVCELAGVSRNALYQYHPQVLLELRKMQQKLHKQPGKQDQTAHELRQAKRMLEEQVTNLAALVDHYFAAWREAASLLERRDRELSELRRKLDSSLSARGTRTISHLGSAKQ